MTFKLDYTQRARGVILQAYDLARRGGCSHVSCYDALMVIFSTQRHYCDKILGHHGIRNTDAIIEQLGKRVVDSASDKDGYKLDLAVELLRLIKSHQREREKGKLFTLTLGHLLEFLLNLETLQDDVGIERTRFVISPDMSAEIPGVISTQDLW